MIKKSWISNPSISHLIELEKNLILKVLKSNFLQSPYRLCLKYLNFQFYVFIFEIYILSSTLLEVEDGTSNFSITDIHLTWVDVRDFIMYKILFYLYMNCVRLKLKKERKNLPPTRNRNWFVPNPKPIPPSAQYSMLQSSQMPKKPPILSHGRPAISGKPRCAVWRSWTRTRCRSLFVRRCTSTVCSVRSSLTSSPISSPSTPTPEIPLKKWVSGGRNKTITFFKIYSTLLNFKNLANIKLKI